MINNQAIRYIYEKRGNQVVAPQSKNKQLKKEVFYNMKHTYKNAKT